MKAGVMDWLYVGHPHARPFESLPPQRICDRVSGPSAPGSATTRVCPYGGTRPRSAGWIHASAHLRPALCGRNDGWGMNGGWEARSSADGRLRRGL